MEPAMSDETTNETIPSDDSAEPRRRRTPRRAATRGVVTPAAVELPDPEDPLASPFAVPFSAPARQHPTREPEQAVDVLAAFGLGTSLPLASADDEDEDTDGEASEGEVSEAETEPEADVPAADVPAETDTTRARKPRRAARSKQSAAAVEELAPTEELAETEQEVAETEEEPEATRLPATALLFQPPVTAPRRKRRRATSAELTAAGSEASGSETTQDETTHAGRAEVTAPTEEPEQTASHAAAQDEATSASGSDEGEGEGEETAGGGRRRRRRGGRNRRRGGDGNGGETADEGDSDAAQAAEGGSEERDGSADPESTGAADETERPTTKRGRGGRGGRSASAKASAEATPAAGEGDAAEAETGDAASSATSDPAAEDSSAAEGEDSTNGSSRRRRRRRGSRRGEDSADAGRSARDEVTALKGSTRLEAKRLRRREGRDAGRRRQIITEAEFLARRESVERAMVVRERGGMTQIAVLEDDVLVEHYVARAEQTSMVGNVYLGRVQNVLPSMEAAFVDLGRGRNAVLYAGEVNWEASGLEGQPRRIEQALKSGDQILVQVTKDPIGHKGARLTAQITLAGRYLVLVPSGAMTGISRKLPDTERARLKKLLKEIVPEGQGVIVRTAAEGATEEELRRDVDRLAGEWAEITKRVNAKSTKAPALLKGEPELALRVVRDVFNEDFTSLTVSGATAWTTISDYVTTVAPDLAERLHHWTAVEDVFASKRIDEQLAKGMDRKVWLPSGGSLVIDRTEAMTVIDVNTGKFTGSGGTLEETVTRNNLEAAEEIVRQLRLRDIGGIIVVDFIDMVLESNRDLVLRRLIECLGRDRTRHQVAEVTTLGLVQMTRKRVGQGLVEAFSTPCEACHGRGFIVSAEPHEPVPTPEPEEAPRVGRRRGSRRSSAPTPAAEVPSASASPAPDSAAREAVKATLAQIAAAAQHAHEERVSDPGPDGATNDPEPLAQAVAQIDQEERDRAEEAAAAVAVALEAVLDAQAAGTSTELGEGADVTESTPENGPEIPVTFDPDTPSA